MDDGPDDSRQWRLHHEIESYVVLDYRPEAPYGQSHVLAGHRTFGAAISFRATGGQEAVTLAWREETKPLNPAVAPAFRCGRAPFSPLSDRASTAPNGLSNGLIWLKTGFASIAYAATAASNFLPLPARAVIPRETRKPSLAVKPLRGAPSVASGLSIAIEAAMVRAR